jgi:hypothetical protein
MSNPLEPIVWAWRKYQLGVPAYHASMVADPSRLFFRAAQDAGQLPECNRWEGLEVAFAGFVGRGGAVATAYWLSDILKLLQSGDLIFRTWHPAVDFVNYQFLGVWFGEKTPFILTHQPEFLDERVQNKGVLYHF